MLQINNKIMPVMFISHGIGPWPFMKGMESRYRTTRLELGKITTLLPRPPTAVLVISGHWEEAEFQVSSGSHPGMEFDYHGFPDYTYHISYPAPGSPHVARRVSDLLANSGVTVRSNPLRGFDQGTFVPMQLMYPHADVPIVVLSLKSTFDAREHIQVGKALAPLRRQNVLIVGSGSTYHNLAAAGSASARPIAERFEQYLSDTVATPMPAIRNEMLADWEKAPDARSAHPREEHLLPLMVAAGAAEDDVGYRLFNEREIGMPLGTYAFGNLRHSMPGDRNRLKMRQSPVALV